MSQSEAVEREALETVLDLIYEIVGAPKDAPYGDLPGYVREALPDKPEIPEGMVLVPKEPTDEMLDAGADAYLTMKAERAVSVLGELLSRSYLAMLAAAPSPTGKETGNG